MATKTAAKKTTKPTSARRTSTKPKTTSDTPAKEVSQKPVTLAQSPVVSVVTEAQKTAVVSELKKRELLDLVVQKSEVKKKFAKPVVEAMLAVLGEAIAEERALNLQPMGRIVPKRTKDAGKNRVVVARIRQSKEQLENAARDGAKQQVVAKAAE